MEKIEHNATTIAAGKDEQFIVASVFEQLLNNFGRKKKMPKEQLKEDSLL